MSTACCSDGLDEPIRKTGFWTRFELRSSPLPLQRTKTLSFIILDPSRRSNLGPLDLEKKSTSRRFFQIGPRTIYVPVRSSRSLPLRRGTGAWYRGTHRAHTNGFVECRGRQVSLQQTSSLCVREKLNFLVSAKMSRKRPTAQPSIVESFAQAAKQRTTLREDDQPNVVVVVDDDPSSDIKR